MPSKTRIVFRADGNRAIGLGHVVRSLALAEMLNQDFNCFFAIQAPDESLKVEIRKICHRVFELPSCTPQEECFTEELEPYISGEDIVVLDGYNFDTDYQQHIKQKGCAVVCIDDIHEFPFVADLVINHGTLDPRQYEVAYYTRLLLGPKYALLRRPFLGKAINSKNGNGVFLCFGGSDFHNLTLRFLKIIADAGCFSHVQVVVGNAYASLDELQKFVQQVTGEIGISLHQGVSAEKLADIMLRCGVAVVPGSSIALECASLGLDLVCGYYAENQKGILKMLADQGGAIDIGNMLELKADQLIMAITSLQNEKRIRRNSYELLVGNQTAAENLLNEFRKLDLSGRLQIRRARESDVDTYYKWVNDPATRSNAVNQAEIPYDAHVQWFLGKVKSEQSYLYILFLKEVPVGQVRFDAEEDAYIIDYSVSPMHRKMGLGRAVMIRSIAQLIQDVEVSPVRLKAVVKVSNPASKKVFKSLHFYKVGSKSINGDLYDSFEIILRK